MAAYGCGQAGFTHNTDAGMRVHTCVGKLQGGACEYKHVCWKITGAGMRGGKRRGTRVNKVGYVQWHIPMTAKMRLLPAKASALARTSRAAALRS
eukprot:300232-Chlamydomonas_euryale.AAC.3